MAHKMEFEQRVTKHALVDKMERGGSRGRPNNRDRKKARAMRHQSGTSERCTNTHQRTEGREEIQEEGKTHTQSPATRFGTHRGGGQERERGGEEMKEFH